MSLTKEQAELKKMVIHDKKFHYMLTDRNRQDISYFIRTGSQEKAESSIETTKFLLSLFKLEDIPEWYTFEDLENDKQRFRKTFGKAL